MRNRIRQFGPTVSLSLGVAATLLAPTFSGAQTNRNVGPTRKVEAPVAPLPVGEQRAPVGPNATPFVIEFNPRPHTAADYLAFETERLRPYLRVEYHFLRTVCSLTSEQRTRIARAAERAYNETIAQYVKLTWSPQLRQASAAPRVFPDPRKLIREGLARAAEPYLDSDQAARYRQEIAQRAEAQRRMVIECYILSLDEALILSAEQRSRIAEKLNADWEDAWAHSESMLLNVDTSVSRIPRQHVLPFLSEEQKKLWDPTLSKSAVTGVWNGNAMVNGPLPALPVDFPEDAELTAARKAEAKDTEGPP
jgi:hypothetical protein